MSKYNDTLLTTEGIRLASLAANGQTHYVITRAVTTANDLSDLTEDELRALTALPDEVQDGSIVGKLDDPNGSEGIIGTQVQFMNQGLDKSYSINAIGLYVKEDGQNEEKFFAIMTAEKEHAQYMPDYADKVILRFGITIFVIVGDKANVTVQFDPDGLASIQFVEDAIAGIPKPDMSQYYTGVQTDTAIKNAVKPVGETAGAAQITASDAEEAAKAASAKADANLEAAKKYAVEDNGDGTVTVNGVKMVPANDSYVVKHNDAGKLQGKLDSDYGDLTVDGAPLMGGTISASQADAVAQSKADLAAGKLVLRWFSDGTS